MTGQDLTEAATEDRGVLGEHAHVAAVDGAVAGDDAVAVGAVLLQAEVGGPVTREGVELHEGARVEQGVDALAGGHLALGVLFCYGSFGACVDRLVAASLQVCEFARGGANVDLVRGQRFRGLGRHKASEY